jgi:small-conductance mechanosensitive channel
LDCDTLKGAVVDNFSLLEIIQDFFSYKLYSVNQTSVTVASLFIFLLILVGLLILAQLLTRFIYKRVISKLPVEESTRYILQRLMRYTLGIIGAVIAFQFIGIDLSSLAFILGLLSVGIGFGLQNVTSNFISGLILLLERPIKVGDRITVGETEGDVIAINMRSTTIRSIDNIAIIVPNSEFISSEVVNWSHGDKKIRINIDVGVSYASNLDTVLRSINEVARENSKVLTNPEPVVHFVSFGDSAWNLTLRCWIAEPTEYRQVASDINCAIVEKFIDNNIEIPFPQRDLHLRSATPLVIEGQIPAEKNS